MGESKGSKTLKWKAVPCHGTQPSGSGSPVHEEAGVHVPQLCALSSTPSDGLHYMVASCDLTTLPGPKSFITLHLLFCQSSELVHFVGDKRRKMWSAE